MKVKPSGFKEVQIYLITSQHLNGALLLLSDKNTEALDSAYLGCWTDQEEARDLPYRIWTRTDDASVPECTHDCNARGFDFAGLQVEYMD